MDIEGIKDDFRCMWVSFVEAVIRFWNNRFQLHREEIYYLQEQIAKLQDENKMLVYNILNPRKEEVEEKIQDFEPVDIGRKRIPWHVRKQKLEFDSRQEAIKLANEASEAINRERGRSERTQTTEEIESELGIGEN